MVIIEDDVIYRIAHYTGAYLTTAFVIYILQQNADYSKIIKFTQKSIFPMTISIALILLIFYLMIQNTGRNKNSLVFIWKYLFLGGGGIAISYFFIDWYDDFVIICIILFVLFFSFLDIINKKKELFNQTHSAFLWPLLIVYLYAFVTCIWPQITINLIQSLYNFPTMLPWKWYFVIPVEILTFMMIVICKLYSDKPTSYDSSIFIMLFTDILFIWLSQIFYTTYTVIFYIILFILHIFVFFYPKENNTPNLLIVISSISVLLSQVAFYFGIFDILFITFIFIFTAYHIRQKQKDSIFYWLFLLTVIVIFGCLLSLHWYHSFSNYIILIIIYIMSIICMLIISRQNPFRPLKYLSGKRILVIAFALFTLCAIIRQGSSIQINIGQNIIHENINIGAYSDEAGIIELHVTANGKNNSVSYVYYYWLDEKDQVYTWFPEADNIKSLAYRNGCLRIIAKDQYGVVTTINRFFHNPSYEIENTCGKLKYQ
jgi:hypothetical protein